MLQSRNLMRTKNVFVHLQGLILKSIKPECQKRFRKMNECMLKNCTFPEFSHFIPHADDQ